MRKVIVGTRGTSTIPEFAGSTWVRMQYVLGLQKLGVEAFWVDRVWWEEPKPYHRRSLERHVERFHRTAQEFGFADRYCVVCNEGERYFGLSECQFLSLTAEADLVVNIGGHLLPPSHPFLRIPRRVYLDVDPGFTQIWAHQEDLGLDRHNFFFTVGQGVGTPSFGIPTRNITWHPTVPPVVLDQWPARTDERCESFSTIAHWTTSQATNFQDQHFGDKRSEFIRFISLPEQSTQGFELALWIEPSQYEDLGLLHRHGWKVLNPCLYAGDPHSYRDFIQGARGEFSVAKHGYIASNSGWISDRTVCYLSSGKPALVQSTGFEDTIPTGKGLLTFRTIAEAVSGVEAINNDYTAHCHAARQLAETHFDSNVVLGRMLDTVGLA